MLTLFFGGSTNSGEDQFHRLALIWKVSLFKTLACKHKSRRSAIAKRLKMEDGYVLTVPGEKKTRSIKVFRLKDLKAPYPNDPRLDVAPNVYAWTLSRSEIIKRLNKKQCEYCATTTGAFEIHHIRKMKDVAKGKAFWQQLMAARNRKTLVLCQSCHRRLHQGTLPDREYFKKHVKGEPDA